MRFPSFCNFLRPVDFQSLTTVARSEVYSLYLQASGIVRKSLSQFSHIYVGLLSFQTVAMKEVNVMADELDHMNKNLLKLKGKKTIEAATFGDLETTSTRTMMFIAIKDLFAFSQYSQTIFIMP